MAIGSIPFKAREQDLRARFETLIDANSKVNMVANSRINNRPRLEITNVNDSGGALLSKHTVSIPLSQLIQFGDIPKEFQIRDIHDPRLYDDAFLAKVANWIQGEVDKSGLTSVSQKITINTVRRVLAFLRDPEFAESAKDFFLGHELGHIFQYQETGMDEVQAVLEAEPCAVRSFMLGIALLVISVALIPLVSLTFGLVGVGVSVGIALISVMRMCRLRAQKTAIYLRDEKDADFRSAKLLGDARSGIYWFDTLRQIQQGLRKRYPKIEKLIDAQGNNRLDKTHPPLTERIRYLREWQKEVKPQPFPAQAAG